jgi:hypothetical protein
MVKCGDRIASGADVELEIQVEGILIPSRVTGAAGAAQYGAGLPVLKEEVQGRRMLESGQGT